MESSEQAPVLRRSAGEWLRPARDTLRARLVEVRGLPIADRQFSAQLLASYDGYPGNEAR
jgi:hypothetical protein